MAKPKYRPLMVEWIDAKFNPSAYTEKEFGALAPLIMLSCGFGIEYEDRVIICTDQYCVEDGELNLRCIHVIPRECIKEITVMRSR